MSKCGSSVVSGSDSANRRAPSRSPIRPGYRAATGTEPATGWAAGFSFGDPAETIASFWSATVSQSGSAVSAANASYDGAIPVGGSVTWGMVVTGSNQTLSRLTCTLS
jgi:hypothetical protein